MKTEKHRILSKITGICCAAAFAVLALTPLHAAADTKSYRTDQADFDISFSDSGTATVTESWTVTYTSGSFTRFYKDIFNPGNQLEYIQDIRVLSCHINGMDAAATDSIDRVDYHYFFEQSDPQMYTVHWFKAAQGETVHYDITYEIPNAVKLDAENNAEYCYRLIGVNFPKTVGEVHLKVHVPDVNAVNEASLSAGEIETDGNTLCSTAKNVSGIYKLRLNMDPKYFSTLQRIVNVQVFGDLDCILVRTNICQRPALAAQPVNQIDDCPA